MLAQYWGVDQGEEAILGCAIAMFSVIGGLCGLAESVQHWHLENLQACLGLAFGGGTPYRPRREEVKQQSIASRKAANAVTTLSQTHAPLFIATTADLYHRV